MIQSMQKFRRNVVYPLVAAMALNVGCATSTSSKVKSVRAASHSKVTFVDKNPRTLREISDAIEDDQEAIKYVRRFKEIKSGIGYEVDYRSRSRSSNVYNPQGDIRRLVFDIEHSNLRNKRHVANTIKGFTYYETNFIEKERRFQHQKTSLFLALLTGAGVYYAKRQEIERTNDTDDSPDAITVISGVTSYFLWNMILDSFGQRTEKTRREKYRINPYHGTRKRTIK